MPEQMTAREIRDEITEATFVEGLALGKNATQAAAVAVNTTNMSTADTAAQRMLKKNSVQDQLRRVMKRKRISIAGAVDPIKLALKATKIVDGKVVPDINMRLRGSAMALKLLGIASVNEASPDTPEPLTGINDGDKSKLSSEMKAAIDGTDEVELQRLLFRKKRSDDPKD